MTVTATSPARTSHARTVGRVVAAALLLGWVLALVPAVSGIERQVSYAALRSDLRGGDVDSVLVSGRILGPEQTGFSVVDVHWERGWARFTTRIAQERGPGPAEPVPDGTTRIEGSVAEALRSLQPGLVIDREPLRSGAFTSLLGDRLTGRWAAVVLVLLLATVMLLVGGPEPKRATRWAWFWLMGIAPPLGAIAFLTLGGSVTGREHLGGRRGRLTGGWAFFLALVLGGATSAGMR